MQTIEGNLAPSKRWCSLFVNAFENRDLEGITPENVVDVKAWRTRGEEIRRKYIKDSKILLLALSPEDAALRSKAMALFLTHPRKRIKDTMTKHGITLAPEALDDENDVRMLSHISRSVGTGSDSHAGQGWRDSRKWKERSESVYLEEVG
jgi:hypothetical protein